APGVSLQVRGEGGPADDPDGQPVPVKPDRGLARAVLGGVGEVGVQRPGEELGQVENGAASGRNTCVDDPHAGPSSSPLAPPGTPGTQRLAARTPRLPTQAAGRGLCAKM